MRRYPPKHWRTHVARRLAPLSREALLALAAAALEQAAARPAVFDVTADTHALARRVEREVLAATATSRDLLTELERLASRSPRTP